MAVLEWKKFDFFNLGRSADNNKVSEAVRDAEITCCSSGCSQKIVCDSLGRIHIFYRNWNSISFSGHDVAIDLCALALQSNLLVTVASRDSGEPATFKVWNLAKVTKRNGAPCLKVVKCENLLKPTAVAVIDNSPGLLFAIGFERGQVALYKGEVSRDFANHPVLLSVGTRPVTGIAFKPSGKINHMFVCSDLGVLVYTIQPGERELKLVLDNVSSPTKCCTLQVMGPQEAYFMAARSDAIYCYMTDGRGPCYALEGQKFLIDFFRNYIVTILRSNTPNAMNQKEFVLIVIDIQNKCIVYTAPIDPVVSILNEAGTCYIVTRDKEVLHLYEKDLQNKLNMLLKKNMFDIAIRMSKDQQYDASGLANVYKQYGDHLYLKGNYSGAVEKYSKTIGFLEPSYVINKFIDSRHINHLAEYLQVLHKEKQANNEHTTLLLNCFSRLELPNKLNDFLVNDSGFVFDLNDALRSQSMVEELSAIQLTKLSRIDDCNMNVLLKNFDDLQEISNFISKFSADEIEKFFKKYGSCLMNHNAKLATELFQNETKSHGLNPALFFPFFSEYPELLLQFLEHVIRASAKYEDTVYNTLAELYLRSWEKGDSSAEDKLLDFLKMYTDLYDKEFILIQCRLHKFWPGILQLYEEEQLYNLTVHYYLKNRDYNSLLSCCKNLGKFQPYLWVQALNGLHNDEKVPTSVLLQILEVVTSEKLLSSLQIVQSITANTGIKIGHIRDFCLQSFQKEKEVVNKEKADVENLKKDVAELESLLHKFSTSPLEFRNTACDACHQPLTIPTTYFLCQHAFHLDCVRTYSENEKDCSICTARNANLMQALQDPHQEQNQHEEFHTLLDRSNDPLQVLSRYLGRSLFNKIVIVDEQKPKQVVVPPITHQQQQYRPAPSAVPIVVAPTIKPVTKTTSMVPKTTKPVPRAVPKNAFDDYDNSKNPFAGDEAAEPKRKPAADDYDNSKNPFAADDAAESKKKPAAGNPKEYDKNLNPFE